MITRKDQTTHDRTEGTLPDCWQRESQPACLRLELPSGETHILSYSHFLAASFRPGKNAPETLSISFSACQVEIDGHGLRELLLTLEDLAVKWVRTVPERFRGAIGGDSGMVADIRITNLANER
ncbi:MAG: hypothetical protein ABSE62_12200 [Chthoniobacteraceae bacterium]|jgi:hypothetical protein